MSIRNAPLGSVSSSRVTVVWRPRPSEARTSPVFWRSSPSSALTSVDLPVPEAPSRTAVVPGDEQVAQDAEALAGVRADRDRVDDAEAAREPGRLDLRLVGEVGLGQDERDGDAAGGRERREALEPAGIGSGSGSVTSARSTLAASTWPAVDLAGRAADDRAGARLDRGDRAAVVELHVIAGDRRLGQPPAGGDELGFVIVRVRPASGRGTARARAQA